MDIMKLNHWGLAIRPKTLPAAACPVVVGAACAMADHHFSFLMFICALAAALLIQISVNLANDYFDFKNNIDTEDRKGPVRVTQSGLIKPETVRNATLFTLGLCLLLGGFLVINGGPVILAIAVVSVICSLGYSGGPYPIASNGLGEVFVFIFFGPVAVCGTYYLMGHTLSRGCLTASIPVGLLITAILVVNNLRDIETDERAGKQTLAVMIGEAHTKMEYIILVLVSFLIPCLMFATGSYNAWILMPLVVFYKIVPLFDTISRHKGEVLNLCLADTAKLALLFSLLFAAGIAVSGG